MFVRTWLESRFKIIAMLTSPPWCTNARGVYSCRLQVFCTQSKHPRYLPRGESGWEVLCSPWLGHTIYLALHCINVPSIQLATSTSPLQLQTTTKSSEVNRIFYFLVLPSQTLKWPSCITNRYELRFLLWAVSYFQHPGCPCPWPLRTTCRTEGRVLVSARQTTHSKRSDLWVLLLRPPLETSFCMEDLVTRLCKCSVQW